MLIAIVTAGNLKYDQLVVNNTFTEWRLNKRINFSLPDDVKMKQN